MNLTGKKLCLGLALASLVSTTTIKADDVEVFAAASLTDALKDIAANYEKTSGDKIIFNFESSGTLATQIKAGAPADLFFSADEEKMDALDQAGLLAPGTRHDLLRNNLAVVAPADSTLTITAPAQLAGDAIKHLALGDTKSVPAGIYAKQYLDKIGIWAQLEPRVIPCQNVRAALAAVETGNVDAGIVYYTDALHSKKTKVIYDISPQDGPKITYPAALVAGSKHADAAKKFLDYLGSPDALKVFAKSGFITGN
jgi:molybdate transport system substrate-binding protein